MTRRCTLFCSNHCHTTTAVGILPYCKENRCVSSWCQCKILFVSLYSWLVQLVYVTNNFRCAHTESFFRLHTKSQKIVIHWELSVLCGLIGTDKLNEWLRDECCLLSYHTSQPKPTINTPLPPSDRILFYLLREKRLDNNSLPNSAKTSRTATTWHYCTSRTWLGS